jgi:hypothetical protein
MCALAYLAAAVVALVAPADAEAAVVRRARGDVVALGPAWRDRDGRRLHLLRGGRAAIRSAVELLVVVAALDLLGMGIAGVGWLTAAWAIGLVAGAQLLRRRDHSASARSVALATVLVAVPLAIVAMSPPPAVGLAVFGVLGVGFALAFRAEAAVLHRLPGDALEGEEVVDALARTSGALLAGLLVIALGDAGALVAVGLLAAALGVGALGLRESRLVGVTERVSA